MILINLISILRFKRFVIIMVNKVWLVAGIILVAIILNFALYLHFGYAFGGDQELVIPNLNSLYNSFFSWTFYNYTGLVAPTGSILGLLFGFDIAIYKLFGLLDE